MSSAVLLLAASLLLILGSAELFTNAVEWLGRKAGLGEGAVGSLLAAVGTALPETLIPIVAIVHIGTEAGHEIGIGAILGAPFMLSTAAFFVTGMSVLFFAARGRRHGRMHVETTVLRRDLGYFLAVYGLAIGAAFLPGRELKVAIAVLLLGLYGFYVVRTLRDKSAGDGELAPLHFDRKNVGTPSSSRVAIQIGVALLGIVAGANLFVQHVEFVAQSLGAAPLVLALIVAPLATELPEKFNSVLWVRRSKDTLAMGNISGAMVFQSCIPVAVGLALTPWELTTPALVSAAIALASTSVVYLYLRTQGYLSPRLLVAGGVFYAAFVSYVVFVV